MCFEAESELANAVPHRAIGEINRNQFIVSILYDIRQGSAEGLHGTWLRRKLGNELSQYFDSSLVLRTGVQSACVASGGAFQ